eukprot:scaffold8409_cov114-Isochrysis_galbana.AAC.3
MPSPLKLLPTCCSPGRASRCTAWPAASATKMLPRSRARAIAPGASSGSVEEARMVLSAPTSSTLPPDVSDTQNLPLGRGATVPEFPRNEPR